MLCSGTCDQRRVVEPLMAAFVDFTFPFTHLLSIMTFKVLLLNRLPSVCHQVQKNNLFSLNNYFKSTYYLRQWWANKRKHRSVWCALLPDGQVCRFEYSCCDLLHPCRPLISTNSCMYHGNLLDERGVPYMVIRPYWSLCLTFFPNIAKLHPTSFSKHTEPKLQKIKWNEDIEWISPSFPAFDTYSHNLIWQAGYKGH